MFDTTSDSEEAIKKITKSAIISMMTSQVLKSVQPQKPQNLNILKTKHLF